MPIELFSPRGLKIAPRILVPLATGVLYYVISYYVFNSTHAKINAIAIALVSASVLSAQYVIKKIRR